MSLQDDRFELLDLGVPSDYSEGETYFESREIQNSPEPEQDAPIEVSFQQVTSLNTEVPRLGKCLDDLSKYEFEECHRIVTACLGVHEKRPTNTLMHKFLAAVFHNWSADILSPPVPIRRSDSEIQGPLKARGGEQLCTTLRGQEYYSSTDVFLYAEIDPQEGKYLFHLTDVNHEPIPTSEIELAFHEEGRGRQLADNYKDVLGRVIRRIDRTFQKYNELRAVQYARYFISRSYRGQAPQDSGEREYQFASTVEFVGFHIPMLWAAASDRLQEPKMWEPPKKGTLNGVHSS
ncbi:hypothetical protein CDD83_4422 [Cordyceps sp. RAO-2017]|nr:hypothetical protein CDD83_4422 [Cordyceps sp. RAO-2017]